MTRKEKVKEVESLYFGGLSGAAREVGVRLAIGEEVVITDGTRRALIKNPAGDGFLYVPLDEKK